MERRYLNCYTPVSIGNRTVVKLTVKNVQASYQVPARVSRLTYIKIKRLIDEGMFLNFSDFTRKAIEDELAIVGETEIISVKQASVQEAREKIEEYLKQRQGPVYPSQIADHYGLELEPVFAAVKQLIAEGKAKEAE